MRVPYLSFLLLACLSLSKAQPLLKPSIGLTALPADSDPICSIPVYNDPSGDFSASGYFAGDTVPHFQLYDRFGAAYDLAQILSQGKPVLLVAGNLTCPIFRNFIDSINTFQTLYGSQVNIYVVYVVEAHPKGPDVSPYSGNVWVTSQNQQQNYLYNQPTTYLKKKNLIDTLQVRKPVNVPILVDGPCNEWWLNYGPAPNNAYLIKPDGIVAVKRGWFIDPPNQWRNDIDSVLQVLSVEEKVTKEKIKLFPNPGNGNFSIHSADKRIVKAELSDLSGRLAVSEEINLATNYELQAERLNAGVYVCKVYLENGAVLVQRICISK
jgi:hypothetical protein